MGGHAFADSKGLLVVFMPPGTDNYLAQWQKGARAKAKDLGYDIKIIESSRDQAEQDSQVQQQIASGEKVAGYIWWPYVNAAGHRLAARVVADRRACRLHQPVSDRRHREVLDCLCGRQRLPERETAAKGLLKACAESKTVKCDKGLIITFPAGYSAGSDRVKAFKKADGEAHRRSRSMMPASWPRKATRPRRRSFRRTRGEITWVYTENDSLAEGVIQALKENGLHPGKDVLVVGGTCHGDTTNLLNGEIVGTGIQAAFLEGWSSVQTTYKYLKTKKVLDGEVYLPADPNTDAVGRWRAAPIQLHPQPVGRQHPGGHG